MAFFHIACVFLVAQALGYQEDIAVEPKQAFENVPPEFQPKANRFDGGCNCGLRSNNRIVGGTQAPDGKYCWQAQLISWGNAQKTSYFLCGGSVICDQYILTAAHCVNDLERTSDLDIYLGAFRNYRDSNAVKYTTETVIIHPDYDTDTLDNDIALIKLTQKIQFGSKICQACLTSTNQVATGTDCIVTGWGNTKENGTTSPTLQEVKLDIYDKDSCEEVYGGDLPGKICAYAQDKDSCQGDSGGPLVNKETSSYEQIGVVSSGYGCARRGVPGLYTSVGEYKTWIYQNTDCKYCSKRN